MRVFVYEYLCGGALPEVARVSLQTEGWAMLSAVLEDFGRCPELQTITLLDPRLAPASRSWPASIMPHFLEPGTEERTLCTLASSADFTLLIAPEFDDILAKRCRWVEDEGGRLLGPSSAAVRFTSDKLTLAHHWIKHGIPTPPVLLSSDWTMLRDRFAPLSPVLGGEGLGVRGEGRPLTPHPSPPSTGERGVTLPIRDPVEPLSRRLSPSFSYPLVCKPRFGAGSQATFLVQGDDELTRAPLRAGDEGWSGPLILQPYCSGLAVSVAFLSGTNQLLSLPAVEQHLSRDGRFRYLGGRLPLTHDLDLRARLLAERAVRTVEGLNGYFGVDLVLGEAADGSDDVVMEINPRLTTSYVGLRRLARFNLAEALLAVATRSPLLDCSWRTESIVFQTDGQIAG